MQADLACDHDPLCFALAVTARPRSPHSSAVAVFIQNLFAQFDLLALNASSGGKRMKVLTRANEGRLPFRLTATQHQRGRLPSQEQTIRELCGCRMVLPRA